eukprot:evm.model.NODE_4596_length_9964_cov_18.431051.4
MASRAWQFSHLDGSSILPLSFSTTTSKPHMKHRKQPKCNSGMIVLHLITIPRNATKWSTSSGFSSLILLTLFKLNSRT